MSKKNYIKEAKPLLLGGLGGYGSMQLTGILEKQSFTSASPIIAPGISFLAAFATYLFMGKNAMVKDLSRGAAEVALAEVIGSGMSVVTGQLQGIMMGSEPQTLGIGYEPTITPQDVSINMGEAYIK